MALLDHWPLFGMRITTPRLELRIPSDDDLAELVEVAAGGVHDRATMPFAVPWTDLPSPDLERSALQYYWRSRSEFGPAKWDLAFAVVFEGGIIGIQALHAVEFGALRSIESGSWLGLPWQRRGIGTEMRAAVVRFAFEYLGAHEITSGASDDNVASQKVSEAVGYQRNGESVVLRRGFATRNIRYRLTRQRWETHGLRVPIAVQGLEPCRPLMGL